MGNKNVPEIRFSSDFGDWQNSKLEALAKFEKGRGYSKKDLVQYGYRAILYGRLYTNYETVIEDVDTYVAKDEGSIRSKAGDVIVPSSGESSEDIARASVVPYTGVILGGDLNIIEVDNNVLDPLYLAFAISNGSTKRELTKRAQGKSVVHLHNSDLKSTEVTYPDIQEQRLISNLLKYIESIITFLQQELTTLKQTKQGFLQKMFPKESETVPEVRFPGFSGEWELRKFNDLIRKLTGGASIKPNDYQDTGIRTIPKGAINSSGVADLKGSKYITPTFLEENNLSKVSTGDLVTSLRDLVPTAPNLGRIVRITGPQETFIMPQGVYRIELHEKVSEDFLIAYSNSDKYRKVISSEKNGSTQVHIRNGEFLNIQILSPSCKEQARIGDFFNHLETNIALQEQELEALQQTKQAFLQKMFV